MNFLRRVFANGLDADLIRLFRMLLPYKGLIALACIFLIGAASMSSLTATLLGKLTDLGFYQEEKWVIFAAPAALIGVSLLFAVSTVMSSILMAKVSQSVLVTLRTELFERMLHWPAEVYQKFSTRTVSSKFVNEANIALSGATNSIIVLVRDIVQVIALLAVLFWHNWQLTLVAFVIAPGLALILRAISRRMRMIVKRSQEALAAMISRVQESYGAARIVKVAGTYDFEDERFAQINGRIRSLAMKTIQTQSLSTPLTQMLTMVAIAFVVGAALFQAQQGLLTFGEFITFLAAMLLLRTPIQALSGLNGTFAAMSTAAKSIFDMLDAELESDKGTIRLGRAKGEIRFEHVFLKYPGQTGYALQDINLTIKPGEHVALVGQSGSGKTSIVNLLPRFWELTSGRITLDGHDIRDLSLESLRRQISIVSQDVTLLDASIRENLSYGLDDITDECMWTALRNANLEAFVRSLPGGLDARVGEGGGMLSGGQKQRLSIARALLKDAPILILDEATSALDSESERVIKDALVVLAKGKTVFTVAHRYSTIENSDEIVVLDSGVISELGPTSELLAQPNGVYRKLVMVQSGSNADEKTNVKTAQKVMGEEDKS